MTISAYQLTHGLDKTAPLALHLLGVTPSFFVYFADAYIERTPAGELRLAVYSRSGAVDVMERFILTDLMRKGERFFVKAGFAAFAAERQGYVSRIVK